MRNPVKKNHFPTQKVSRICTNPALATNQSMSLEAGRANHGWMHWSVIQCLPETARKTRATEGRVSEVKQDRCKSTTNVALK